MATVITPWEVIQYSPAGSNYPASAVCSDIRQVEEDFFYRCFGHEFYEAELRYLVEHEWVRRLDDAIWRRTKQGMWLNAEQQSRISAWLVKTLGKPELSLAS